MARKGLIGSRFVCKSNAENEEKKYLQIFIIKSRLMPSLPQPKQRVANEHLKPDVCFFWSVVCLSPVIHFGEVTLKKSGLNIHPKKDINEKRVPRLGS